MSRSEGPLRRALSVADRRLIEIRRREPLQRAVRASLDGAVGTAELAPNVVTAAKIAAAAVDTAHLAYGAVGSAQLAAGAVTASKLATGAVDGAALANAAVPTGTVTIDPAAIDANTCLTHTAVVAGVLAGDRPVIHVDEALEGGLAVQPVLSTVADQIRFRICNTTEASLDGAPRTHAYAVLR